MVELRRESEQRSVARQAVGESSIARSLAAAAQDLATRIDGGATLWSVAPGLDDHARHFAVEFVHPASVGARAVAAIAISTMPHAELIDCLRSSVSNGDVVVTMGDWGTPLIVELGIRCQAWGVTHVHIGWTLQDRVTPALSLTRFVDVGTESNNDRLLTRAYHVLWELTFICLQRKMTVVRAADAQTSCAVCSDEAVVAEIASILPNGMASVRSACGSTLVDVSLVPPLSQHDLVLAHAGTALRLLSLERPVTTT